MKVLTLLLFLIPSSFGATAQIISEITFEGNRKTKTVSLQKLLKCKVGEELDTTLIIHDINNLSRLPSIAAVSYSVMKDTSFAHGENYKIIFDIEENYSILPFLNLWNADSILAVQAGLYEVNFLGRNLSIGGYYQYNGLSTFGITLSAPYIIKGRLGIEVNIQRWSSYEPLYFKNKRLTYKLNVNSNELLFLYRINAQQSFKVGGSRFRESYTRNTTEMTESNSSFPLEVDLSKMLYKFEYEFNKVNYLYYKLDGLKNQFYFQKVTTLGETSRPFFVGWNDLICYKRIKSEGNFAVRIRVGISSNAESPFAPFVLDNQINIRGSGNLSKRGTATFVLNSEYRHTLLLKKNFRLQGNVFVDMGSLRSPAEPLSALSSNKNIDIHSGIGARFIHKTIYNAIFRIDYGIGLTKENSNGFVIGIGQYF